MGNVIPGGLGGVGGEGGPKEVLKGISNVGSANESDAMKFQTYLSGEGSQVGKSAVPLTESRVDIKGPSGPFDFQTNRVKDSDIVAKPGLGHVALEETQKFMAIGRNQEQAMMVKMKEARETGYNPLDIMELQFNFTQYGILIETFSKASNKMVQNIQTMAKNQ